MHIEIRNFQDSDLEYYAALYNASEAADPDFRPLTAGELQETVLKNPAYDPRGHFVVFEADKLVCSARGIYIPEVVKVKGPVGYIEFYVLPSYLGTNVENEVFARIVEYLKSHEVEWIQTRVDTRFEAKVHLLERLGLSKAEYENHGMELNPRLAEKPRTPEGYRIRTAKMPDEIETMLRVFNEAFATRDKYPPMSLERFRKGWAMKNGENHSGFFLAERKTDNRVVGMVLSGINQKYNENHGVKRGGTYALAVIPSERRKGLGTALTLKSIEWIGKEDMDISYVSVNVANQDALKIYQALGYRTVQIFQGYQMTIV
jgi:ribosomal protein S18 acetylase RimI-like enzyme